MCKQFPENPPHQLLLLCITQKSLDLHNGNLYEAARQAWRIGAARRASLQYALAVRNGLIEEVYEITGWEEAEIRQNIRGGRISFWAFAGEKAAEDIREMYIGRPRPKPFPQSGYYYWPERQ